MGFTRLNIRHNIQAILTEYTGRDFLFHEMEIFFFFLPRAITSTSLEKLFSTTGIVFKGWRTEDHVRDKAQRMGLILI